MGFKSQDNQLTSAKDSKPGKVVIRDVAGSRHHRCYDNKAGAAESFGVLFWSVAGSGALARARSAAAAAPRPLAPVFRRLFATLSTQPVAGKSTGTRCLQGHAPRETERLVELNVPVNSMVYSAH
ncbi:hypothetical protein AAFF_G00089470 [Aldrovandia affinis]|uniref:Uncharacterized protein n=1 Tax=Aldrovandia affinis TaxID=143900 RepID=A0AAD7RWJ6_9TELE|nr:hypothetical protein AAFF_G00089470 [Aldrovandia affinis]